ncbi:MAG: hypothetical protein ACK40G_01860 [Cytophagaceae bacterium]
MQAIGVILMVVGFLIGVFGGMALSLPSVVIDNQGKVSQDKMLKITIAIIIGSAMIMLGQFLFAGYKSTIGI